MPIVTSPMEAEVYFLMHLSGSGRGRLNAGLLALGLVVPATAVAEKGVAAPPSQRVPSAPAPEATPELGDVGTARKPLGANLVQGKYVYMRGLGDRYSNALLGGVPLPSSDPDRRAVPLSAMPAALRASARIETTFLPDAPGDFAGGSLRLQVGELPVKTILQLKMTGAVNGESSFRASRAYAGGSDYFGVDDGTRALPSRVPSNQPVRIGEGSPPMSRDEASFIGRGFRNTWESKLVTAGMDHGLAGTYGGSVALGSGRFGYLLSASFAKAYRRRISEIANLTVEGGKPVVRERFVEERGAESTTWGGFLHTGFRFDARHDISLVSLLTHKGSDVAKYQTGRSESLGLDIQATRLRFMSESLLFTRLEGNHRLAASPWSGDGRAPSLRWHAEHARTSQDQPDMRDLTYDNPGSGFGLRSVPGSGERFFANLTENAVGGGVDVTVPIGPWALKTGVFTRFARRSFIARRFWFELQEPSLRFASPEVVFAPERIGPSVRIDERTLATDHYDADVWSLAGYVMADVLKVGPVRLTGGLRYEYFVQDLFSLNPLVGTADQAQSIRRSDLDPLPALAAVWRWSDTMNLVATYSNTVSRPQLRELAPFKFFNFTRQRLDEGNPKLRRAYLYNTDLRWSWTPNKLVKLSVGAFYKYLSDPIERVIFDDRRSITYENAASATVYGAELDGAVDLGVASPSLRGLRIAAQVALSDSTVGLKPEQVRIQTSRQRPLQGQAPYIVDLVVGYDARRLGARFGLHYSVVGPRIVDVGSNFLPDVFQQPFHRVDFSWTQQLAKSWQLGLSGGNVLNQPVSLRGGDVAVLRYRPGADVSLSLAYTP